MMRKITNYIRKNYKTKLAVVAVLAVAAIAVPTAVRAGYGPNGPDRVVFDWNNPAQKEGAFDAPRFNSYINTPVYGDERAFLDTKECVVNGPECYSQGASGGYKDKSEAKVGKEYIVRAYVHNIANPSINGANLDGKGVAKNTKIRFEIPSGVGGGFTMQARISADNAIPQTVYDTADLDNTTQSFALQYVPDSAYISNAAHPGGLKLSNDVVGPNGTLIGYDQMNGIFPGCFEFSAYVTIRVKVVAPTLDVQKRVSKVDMPKLVDSKEQVTAKRGEAISWRIDYSNTGSDTAQNIVIRDQIPEGLTLVPGSIVLTTAAGTETLNDTALSSGGVDVGDYSPNGNGVIRFKTTINEDLKTCELTNWAYGRAQNIPEIKDNAKVVIEDCQQTTPVYRCDLLKVEKLTQKNTYRFTTDVTALNGATVKQYRYSFTGTGYNQTAVSNQTNGQIDHVFPGPGTYNVKVTVDFTVDGKTVSHTSNTCETVVKITENPQTPPRELPNTGAGDIIGIAAAVTVAGAVAHRYFYSRFTV